MFVLFCENVLLFLIFSIIFHFDKDYRIPKIPICMLIACLLFILRSESYYWCFYYYYEQENIILSYYLTVMFSFIFWDLKGKSWSDIKDDYKAAIKLWLSE